jgi:hypothetical protein
VSLCGGDGVKKELGKFQVSVHGMEPDGEESSMAKRMAERRLEKAHAKAKGTYSASSPAGSHAVVLTATEELKKAFEKDPFVIDQGRTRAYRITIVGEHFTLAHREPLREKGWTPRTIIANDDDPCYLAIERTPNGQWLLVNFVPDTAAAPVRLLYASR